LLEVTSQREELSVGEMSWWTCCLKKGREKKEALAELQGVAGKTTVWSRDEGGGKHEPGLKGTRGRDQKKRKQTWGSPGSGNGKRTARHRVTMRKEVEESLRGKTVENEVEVKGRNPHDEGRNFRKREALARTVGKRTG